MNGYDLALGARLARGGTRYRVGITVLTCALATASMLALLALPRTLLAPGSSVTDRSVVRGLIGAFLVLPVAASLVTAGRLSGRARRQRLAALRLLGTSPRRTRLLGGLENAWLSLPGTLLGVLLAPGLCRLVEAAVHALHLRVHHPVAPSLSELVAIPVLVLASMVAAGSAPVDAKGRHRSAAVPMSLLRLLPGVAGIGLWTVLMLEPLRSDPGTVPGTGRHTWFGDRTFSWLQFVAVVLLGVGVLTATPWLLRVLGRLLSRRVPWVPATVAGRRLESDPAATGRLVGALGLGILLAGALLGVVAGVATTPDFVWSRWSREHGPTMVLYPSSTQTPVTAQDRDQLRHLPGVRAVAPDRSVGLYREDPLSTGTPYTTTRAAAFVGTCAELREMMDVATCDDAHPAWLDTTRAPAPAHDGARAPGAVDLTPAQGSTRVSVGDGTTAWVDSRGPTVPARLRFDTLPGEAPSLFVPRSLVAGVSADRGLLVWVEPGTGAREAVRAWAEQRGMGVNPGDDDLYTAVRTIIIVLLAMACALVAVLAATSLVAAVDRALETRRTTVALRSAGTSPRTLAAAEAVQVSLPLLVAGGLASLLGAAAPLPFLREMALETGLRPGLSWPLLATLLGLVALATMPVAGTVALLVPRTITPADLRRE